MSSLYCGASPHGFDGELIAAFGPLDLKLRLSLIEPAAAGTCHLNPAIGDFYPTRSQQWLQCRGHGAEEGGSEPKRLWQGTQFAPVLGDRFEHADGLNLGARDGRPFTAPIVWFSEWRHPFSPNKAFAGLKSSGS